MCERLFPVSKKSTLVLGMMILLCGQVESIKKVYINKGAAKGSSYFDLARVQFLLTELHSH